MLKRILLLLGLLLAVPAGGQNCLPCAINAVARFDLYVSNVSYGGIPIGDDTTGDGSSAHPYLTIDRALQQRLTGTSVYLNGNPASPAVYTTSSGLLAGTYSILAASDYGAIIAGTGTAQALTLPLDGHLTLGKVIIDPSQNSGGPAAVGLTIATNLNPYTRMSLALVGTQFQNWTSAGVTGVNVRATISTAGAVYNGGTVGNGFYVNAMAAGSVSSTGDSCTLTGLNLANTGGCMVVLGSSGTTATVNVTNPNFSCTLSSALVGANLYYCIRLHDIPGATVSGGNSSVLGAPGASTGAAVYLSTANNDISNSSISNITVVNTTNGGYGCGAGGESVTAAPVASNVLITGCVASGNATSGAGGLHCVFIGANIQNSSATNNSATTCGISYVNKLNSFVTFSGNTSTGWYSSDFLIKGAANANLTNNVGTQNIAAPSTVGWMVEDDPTVPTHSTNAVIGGNAITNSGGISLIYAKVDPSNTFTAANDNYVYQSGTNAANVFQIQGTNFTTCPLYRAAFEPSATCVGF